jgi:putative transcriptional regulator
MIKRHPDSTLLVEYSSGSLALAPNIAITTHLQFCDQCRRTVNALENIGGDLLDATESVPVSEDLLDKVLNCIDDSNEPTTANQSTVKNLDDLVDAVPTYIQRFLPEGRLNWKFLSPSLKVAAISIGEDVHELAFHKIKAGGKAPEHNHQGTEITVVLKGSFSDDDDIYHPGDFIIREPGDIHQPIATKNEECVCLSVLSAPIQLTGVKRLLNPFLSFSPS